MSGIETIKIIVNAEKEAAKILEEAQNRASEIRKRLDSMIQEQREDMLHTARKEAATLVEEGEQNGKAEAAAYEKEAENDTRQILARASARKDQAVTKVVETVLGLKA
jgi:vacuolar-type H+-ATPase subunit H